MAKTKLAATTPPAAPQPASQPSVSLHLKLDLENCYGIKKLVHDFDFSTARAYAIYAGNGAMKSSLAQTLKDVAEGADSKDRVFPNRVCKRIITDEHDVKVTPDRVVVVRPYDEKLEHTEKTSTLLVNAALRKEYEDLHIEIDKAKEAFLAALRKQSGSRQDLEQQISATFMNEGNKFEDALHRVKHELQKQKDAPFAEVEYDILFDEKVLALLGTKNVKEAIDNYIKKYNELLAASTYFKKGVFNYHNASTIAKSLADNGFFAAEHTVSLNGNEKMEITSQKQLEDLIQKEKDAILKDKQLRRQFDDLEKAMYKNAQVRAFGSYLEGNEWIVPELVNVDVLKQKIWKSYFKVHFPLYEDLINKYQAADKRRREIEEQAANERTQWERVIEIFNDRFVVPFTLVTENRTSVMLGDESVLRLSFIYTDGPDSAPIAKDKLLEVLSQGERRALYILNVIFEIETRRDERRDTIFVVDDIADSFDYKNKYAIIQYLRDVAAIPFFRQIILTHNFDFFRTLHSRFIHKHSHCLMALKDASGISLSNAVGIKNIFVRDWKTKFFTDPKKRIASIAFIRNLIEMTTGESDPDYLKLTSLLHWKSDSLNITQADLDAIYNRVFRTTGMWATGTETVVDAVSKEASNCIGAASGVNFEHKIVLSIGTRLLAEKFMADKINDAAFLAAIEAHQTPELLKRFKADFPADADAIATLDQVVLMTPENIHLNSFMYEPILDMSDEHLRRLYLDVAALT